LNLFGIVLVFDKGNFINLRQLHGGGKIELREVLTSA
jgi:hypothetical protein